MNLNSHFRNLLSFLIVALETALELVQCGRVGKKINQ